MRIIPTQPATEVRRGTLLVALGSALWATDLIFRRGLAEELAAAEVVFWEHLILALICVPILVRSDLRVLTRRDWIAVILVGAGASVVATILLTEAFSYDEPTTVVLLQKIQPLVVILGARIMLGERLKPNFWMYAVPAIAGAYLLSTPSPSEVTLESFTPALLSIGAATLWGLGTVLGRRLLNTIPFMTQTALRFVVGFPMAAIISPRSSLDSSCSTTSLRIRNGSGSSFSPSASRQPPRPDPPLGCVAGFRVSSGEHNLERHE